MTIGRTSRVRLAVALSVLLASAWTASAAARSGTPAVVRPTQRVVALLATHVAYSQPSRSSARVGSVPARGPLTGQRTVLPVLGSKLGPAGLRWLWVRLPGRPNGHTGWISEHESVVSGTSWHIVVDTSGRRVVVYRQGRPVLTVGAVVGKPSTPTPRGEFYVEETMEIASGSAGAPLALALSARCLRA